MKAKIKFDQQVIKDFFIQHCEKLVLSLIVLVFLGMAWSALTRESYVKTPSQLQQLATDARSRIANTDPKSLPVPAIVDYRKEAEDGQKFIASVVYDWKNPWNPQIFPRKTPRRLPRLYPVEQLAATADFGAFSMRAGEGAGAAIEDRGQRWVVITGLVAIAQQVAAYNEALKGNPRPETDTPKYYTYEVQRAEVFGDSRDENPAWAMRDLRAAYAPTAGWTNPQLDVVATQYISEKLAFPLGPLSNKSWDTSVAHPPEIPLAADAPAAPAGRDESGATPPGASAAPGVGPAAGVGPPGAPAPRAPAGVAALAEGQKYMLFRFFDFSVQPGKRYRYQVRLYLENPNYNYEPRHALASPDLAKDTTIVTDWCEATKPVYVQRDDRLLAASVKPAIRAYMEPTATLTVVKWMESRGTQSQGKFDGIHRGQLLNLSGAGPAAESDAPEPALGEPTPKPTPGAKKSQSQTLYRTDALLLDMQGGERFPGRDKQTEPSYLLVLDYDNALVVRSELEDEMILAKLNTPRAAAEGEGGMAAPVAGKGPAAGGAVTPAAEAKKTKAGGAAKKGAVEELPGGLFGGGSGEGKKKKK